MKRASLGLLSSQRHRGQSLPQILLLFLSCLGSAQAATLLVPSGFSTVQAAIDSATHGDEIVVATGTYHERIHFHGKNIILRSTDPTDPAVVAATIIDASKADSYGSAVTFGGSESEQCVLAGFTVTNGYSTRSAEGGGIEGHSTHATLRGNVITKNWTHYELGGVVFHVSGLIDDNIIFDNLRGSGLGGCGGTIQNNLIYGNLGPGIYVCNGIIQNNTIYGNSHPSGAGIANCQAAVIRNNIVWGNTSAFPQLHSTTIPVYCCIEGWVGEGTGNIIADPRFANPETGDFHLLPNSYCVDSGSFVPQLSSDFEGDPRVWNDSPEPRGVTPAYSCIEDWEGGGEGNFSVDPQFVDRWNEDFHLRPDSPCIDAGRFDGSLEGDFEGNQRPIDSTSYERGDGSDFDIGAYEFVGVATPNPRPGRPENLSPVDGATDVVLNPTLSSSAFVDPDPADSHVGSRWQVDVDADFSSPVLDTGLDVEHKTQFYFSTDRMLDYETTYWWRLRYLDTHNSWSDWSNPTRFHTRGPGLYVPEDYPTIQAAIDGSRNGEEIVVQPGTYNEAIHLKGKNIVLRSLDPEDPEIVAGTIISNPYSWEEATVLFAGTETSACVLTGFTITGLGNGVTGNSAYPTIRLNVITQNSATGIISANGNIEHNEISWSQKAGVRSCSGRICDNIVSNNSRTGISECHGLICDNRITENGNIGVVQCNGSICRNSICYHTMYGLYECNGMIDGNNITNNFAGGMYNCDGDVRNNIVLESDASGLIECDGQIYNNTIYSNSSDPLIHICDATIENCILWRGSDYDTPLIEISSIPSFCCIKNWSGGGKGNISFDPLFRDPANEDLRLLPSSPCVDAGKCIAGVDTDIEGEPRPMDGTLEPRGDGSDFDIGADEFYSLFNLRSDINADNCVGHLDLFIFQGHWKTVYGTIEPCNMNLDEDVNALDLYVMMEDWHRETGP